MSTTYHPSRHAPSRPAPLPPPRDHPPTAQQHRRDQPEPVETRPLKKAEREDVKRIGAWKIGRTIGRGSSGRVKLAKHSKTGQYAAVKIVPKQAILSSRMSISEAGAKSEKVLLGIEREIIIMKLIDHPNVMNLYDVWETNGELYLIMEYVPGGELFDYLVSRGRLKEDEALHYFQQIIHAVDYCHRFNICHRDLKPENLLLDEQKNIKVADFGMAAWQAGERLLETSCGSPHYASPEIVAGKAYNGASSDIWSCGVILYALLAGRLPFDDDNIRVLLQKVKVGRFEMPDEIQGQARHLLYRMLDKDPVTRIKMEEIIVHPFFVSRPRRKIPGREFVVPPSVNAVDRPVDTVDEIDSDILGNLRTLFHGEQEDVIVRGLLSKERTWEKAIYHLLQDYREKHMENFNMDDDEVYAAGEGVNAPRHHQQPAPARHQQPAPATTKRHVVQTHRRKTSVTIAKYSESGRQNSNPNLSSDKIASNHSSPSKHRPSASGGGGGGSRPSAPTPTKASEGSVRSPPRLSELPISYGQAVGSVALKSTAVPPPQLRLPVPSRTNTTTSTTSARSPAGPRPPLSPRASSEVTTTTVPAIILQEPSPNRPASTVLRGLSQSSEGGGRPTSIVGSPSPTSYASEHPSALPVSTLASTPSSPSPSPLTIPQVQNMEVQRFFEEIAEQLNTIQQSNRHSVSLASPSIDPSSYLGAANGGYPLPLPSPNGTSPQHMVFPPFRPVNAANAPPTTPVGFYPAQMESGARQNDAYDQFEDAENDNSDIASIHSNAHTLDGHGSVRTPSVYNDTSEQMLPAGVGLGLMGHPQQHEYGRQPVVSRGNSVGSGPREQTSLRPPASPNKQIRWSVASSVGSNSSQKQASYYSNPQQHAHQHGGPPSSYRTPSGSSYGSDKENGSQQQQQYYQQQQPQHAHQQQQKRQSVDRVPIARKPAPVAPVDVHHSQAHGQRTSHANGRQPLGDGRGYNSQQRARPAPDTLPTPTNKSSASRARKPALPPLNLHQHSPSSHASESASSSASSNKRSWFTNLFSFKAPSHTLYSLEDRRPTLLATRQLLESFGAVCTQEGSIGSHSNVVLRCRMDEIRDPSGSITVSKAVRFRVDFQPCTERVGSASGFVTMVVMVQEKGALSTFKSIYGKVSREWELDGPKTASVNPRLSMAGSHLGGNFVYV